MSDAAHSPAGTVASSGPSGVDSDQYDTVQSLPGVVDPARWQRHILTSVTKSFEDSIYDVLAAMPKELWRRVSAR